MARRKFEEEEIEANLLPVMNVMLLLIPGLLMAMEFARMAAISVMPPKYAQSAPPKEDTPKEKPLDLKVFILEEGYRVSAAGQQAGAEAGQEINSNAPTIPLAKPGTELDVYDRYDYGALEAEAKKYKGLFPNEFAVTLSAEGNIPMQVLISTMDALRGTSCKLQDALSKNEQVPEDCYFYSAIFEAGAG